MLRPRYARATERRNGYSRFVCAALAALGLVAASGQTAAQSENPPVIEGEVAPPVEMKLEVVNGEVRCLPPTMRLPGGEPIQIRFQNFAERPLMFFAPDFFRLAEIVVASGVGLDAASGGLLVPAQTAVEVLLEETPPAGEYGYACTEVDEQPTPRSSGFLEVLPVAED